MATSRGGMPADPTLSATTDDNSRGGLFTRSNVGNIVQGVNVSDAMVNDSTITITLNYADSTSESQTFTTNQSSDGTLTFTVPGSTDSGGGGANTGNDIASGSYDQASQILTLVRQDSSNPIMINLADLVNEQELTNRLAALASSFTDLTDTPSSLGSPGEFIRVNTAGTGLEFTPRPEANTALTDFETSDTVIFRQGTSDTTRISADARVQVGNGTASSTAVEAATSVIVDPATGYQIVEVGSTGVFVFQEIPTTPTNPPAQAPSFTQPPASRATDPSPAIMETITAQGGTFNSVTATVETPSGGTITPMVTGPGGGAVMMGDATATITIPAGAANPPGDYTIMATTMTLGADGVVREDTPEVTVDRFIPYFVTRTEVTAGTDLSTLTPVNAAFNGSFETPPGAGPIFLVALAGTLPTGIPNTNGRVTVGVLPLGYRFIAGNTLTLADSTTRAMNIIRFPHIDAGTMVNL